VLFRCPFKLLGTREKADRWACYTKDIDFMRVGI
jgi:hypothetical protein